MRGLHARLRASLAEVVGHYRRSLIVGLVMRALLERFLIHLACQAETAEGDSPVFGPLQLPFVSAMKSLTDFTLSKFHMASLSSF